MMSKEFVDFPLSSLKITSVSYAHGRVFIETEDKLFYVARNAVSRVAKALGVKKTEFLAMARANPDKLKKLLDENANVVLMAFRSTSESGIWIIYNASTEKFVAVRHRDVLAAATEAFKELGLSPKVITKKFRRRLVYYFVVSQQHIGNVSVSLEVAVSNANTVRDAIHVYPHIAIFAGKRKTDVSGEVFAKSKRIMHVGDPSKILERVKKAVKEVYADLKANEQRIISAVAAVSSMPVPNPRAYMYSIISSLNLPKKYFTKINQAVNEAEQRRVTVFDVLNFLNRLYHLVADNNETLAKKIETEMKRLLTSPSGFRVVKTK